MFTTAIVRTPCPEIVSGLTNSNLGTIDYQKALNQHQKYIEALQSCDVEVNILDSDSDFPDSVFVEDTAICLDDYAIITRPGAPSRRDETYGISNVLSLFLSKIDEIKSPGTLDGGDVLKVEDHYYIGLSERTNEKGADQLIRFLENQGKSASKLLVTKSLHLKSSLSYLGNNNLLAYGKLAKNKAFKKLNVIEVAEEEAYAANAIQVNGKVILPAGYRDTKAKIKALGYKVKEVKVSEFQKVDGSVTCLSLLF